MDRKLQEDMFLLEMFFIFQSNLSVWNLLDVIYSMYMYRCYTH